MPGVSAFIAVQNMSHSGALSDAQALAFLLALPFGLVLGWLLTR